MGWFSDVTGGILDPVSDELADVDTHVRENFVDLRDGLQTAAVIAGNYYLPGSSLLTSQLVTKGAQENLNSDLGRVANIAAGASGGLSGNAANYGKLGEAAGLTSGASSAANTAQLTADAQFLAADASQLAAQGLSQAAIEQNLVAAGVNSFAAADAAQLALQGIPPDQMSTLLTQSSGTASVFSNPAVTSSLSSDQIARLAKAGIQLAGIAGAANALDGTGGLGLSQQDRSGFSSGSADYGNAYYQQIQNKYNQYMPQAKGADITADLKNWYETKYTPNATGFSTGGLNTGGTGLGGLNQPFIPVVTKQPVQPLYTTLTPSSSAKEVVDAYSQYISKLGGNSPANRQAANDYLLSIGMSQGQINAAYDQYLSTLPASGNTPSSVAANATPAQIAQAFTAYVQGLGGNTQANRTAAAEYLKSIGVPVSTIEAGYKSYLGTLPASGASVDSLNANASPSQIAAAYANYISGAGGDTDANKQAAIQYLQNIGVPASTIQAAYPVFKSTYGGGSTGGGMLTGGGGGVSSGGGGDYTSLSGGSSAADIAAAYSNYVAGAGGDTAANQAAAVSYLSGLGVDQGTINSAYDIYKG